MAEDRITTDVNEDLGADRNESDFSDVLDLSCKESDFSFEDGEDISEREETQRGEI